MPSRRQEPQTASGRAARKSAINNPFCPSSPKTAGKKPSFPIKPKAATPVAKAKAVAPIAKAKAKTAVKTKTPVQAKTPVKVKTPVKAKTPAQTAAVKKAAAAKAKLSAAKVKIAATKAKKSSPPAKSKQQKATPARLTKAKPVVSTKKKTPELKRKAPNTQKQKPATLKKSETPKKKPETPKTKPETPKKRPATPTRAESRKKRPQTPTRKPETSKKKPETPQKRPETPKGRETKNNEENEVQITREERMKKRDAKEVEVKIEPTTPRRAVAEAKKRAASQSPRGNDRKKRSADVTETKAEKPSQEKAFDMKIKMKTYGRKIPAVKGKAKAIEGPDDIKEEETKQEDGKSDPQTAITNPSSLPPLEEAPRRIICLDCGEAFTDRKLLTAHKRVDCKSIFPEHKTGSGTTEAGQKMVLCGQCGKHCSSKEAFLKHSENCQRHSKVDDKLRKCSYCFPPVWFPGFPLFLNHMREAHSLQQGHNLFMCNKCSSLFMTKLDLQTHKGAKCEQNAAPDGVKESICCKKCKATFNTVQQLKNHTVKCKAGHTLSIVCNYCNTEKSYNTEKELHTHKVECHEGVGLNLFTCTVCGKCFDFDKERVKHQATHQTSPRVEVPMADIMKKIGEIPKVGSRERGFGSNADVASPFITELSASNGNHAFAIKIDTSSGKPQVTVGLDDTPVAPNVSTPVVSRIKQNSKGMLSTSSPPKLSISTGQATPSSKPRARQHKVGYVIGSLNLVSAQPVGPQAGTVSGKKAATERPEATKASPRAVKQAKKEQNPQETIKIMEKPKEAMKDSTDAVKEGKGAGKNKIAKSDENKYEEKTGSKKEEEKKEKTKANTGGQNQIPTVVADQKAETSPAPPLKQNQTSKGKASSVIVVRKASAGSIQARIEQELGKGAKVIYTDNKQPVKRARKSFVSSPIPAKRPAPSNIVPPRKEVPVMTKMLQAKTPAGKPIMVPIAITQGIHVEPVEGNMVKCSECEFQMSSMAEVASHSCSRCMRCLTIMHSLNEVADHICTASRNIPLKM